jgi:D-serine deaminase-like pyridoxal phosphate-dependent protein
VKGWPLHGEPEGRVPLAGDWAYPVALLAERALRHNIGLMARYCERHGALLAPHAKTSMAPWIVDAQVAAGAWGMTVAHVGQARELDVERIVIANEVVSPGELEWIAAQDRRVLLYVDSIAGVERVSRAAGPAPIEVLVEVGYAGGRTGCRTAAEATDVARAAAAARNVRVAGVAAYEGFLSLEQADGFLAEVAAVAEALAADGVLDGEPLLTAGGSMLFDRVVAVLGPAAERIGGRLLLRAGCYVTHDHGVYERLGPAARGALEEPFVPALEIWGVVLSRPEPTRAIAGAGKRDLASDMGLPIPLPELVRDGERVPLGPARVVELNDQHAHLELAADADVRPGDLAGFGISHPCAAFDRWRHLALVDDDGRVVEMIATLF